MASLLKNTSWNVVGGISQSVTGLLSGVLLARLLYPDDMGIFLYSLWVTDSLSVLFGFGLQNTIIRFIGELSGNTSKYILKSITKIIFVIYLLLNIIASIFLLFLLYNEYIIKINAEYKIWSLLILMFVIRSIGAFYQAYLSGTQNFRFLTKINLLSNILQIITLFLGIKFFGLLGAFIGYSVGSFVPALFSLSIIFDDGSIFINGEKNTKKRIFSYATNTWMALLIGTLVWSRSEIFFIKSFVSNEAVAFFSIGLAFSGAISQLPTLFAGAMLPRFAENFGQKNIISIQKVYSSATLFLAAIIFPATFFLAILCPIFVPIVYGNTYLEAIAPAQVLIMSGALSFVAVGTSVVMAMEKSRFIFLSGIIGAIFSIIVSITFIPLFGLMGASIAKFASQFFMICLGTYYIHCHLKIKMPFKSVLKLLVISLLSSFVLYVLVNNLSTSLIYIILEIIMSVLIYILGIRYIGFLDKGDRYYIIEIVDRLPGCIRKFFSYAIKN